MTTPKTCHQISEKQVAIKENVARMRSGKVPSPLLSDFSILKIWLFTGSVPEPSRVTSTIFCILLPIVGNPPLLSAMRMSDPICLFVNMNASGQANISVPLSPASSFSTPTRYPGIFPFSNYTGCVLPNRFRRFYPVTKHCA